MGDLGIGHRTRSGTGISSKSSLLSSPESKKKFDGFASAASGMSSSTCTANPANCESESQSGSDTDDAEKREHYIPESFQNPKRCTKSDVFNTEKCEPNDQNQHKKAFQMREKKKKGTTVETCVTFILLGVAILVVPFLAWLPGNSTEQKMLQDIESNIVGDLDKLRSESQQERHFWRSLYSGLTTVTEAAPRQPLVLLMAVPLDASLTAVCLSHHITDIVSRAFNDSSVVKHDTISYLNMPWADHKVALDNNLDNLDKVHAAIIYNFEKMPPNTATLLHGYFDNENAPYKRAVIVVLLELELHYSSVSEAHLDLTVERRLHELWRQDLDQDNIPGLISRVAMLPLLVKPESEFVLQQLCPST